MPLEEPNTPVVKQLPTNCYEITLIVKAFLILREKDSMIFKEWDHSDRQPVKCTQAADTTCFSIISQVKITNWVAVSGINLQTINRQTHKLDNAWLEMTLCLWVKYIHLHTAGTCYIISMHNIRATLSDSAARAWKYQFTAHQ